MMLVGLKQADFVMMQTTQTDLVPPNKRQNVQKSAIHGPRWLERDQFLSFCEADGAMA
jgi:hypothetical protein